MFVFNHHRYDATTDFPALLDKWLQTSGAPELESELQLGAALASLDYAAVNTMEHYELARAALDRMERGTCDEVAQLKGVSVVLAPRAIDRLLGLAPDKWRAYGGWQNLLYQLEQVAPFHPRFVPLLRNRAERSRTLDRWIGALAQYDGAWLAANLARLPRCSDPASVRRALRRVGESNRPALAQAVAAVYRAWGDALCRG